MTCGLQYAQNFGRPFITYTSASSSPPPMNFADFAGSHGRSTSQIVRARAEPNLGAEALPAGRNSGKRAVLGEGCGAAPQPCFVAVGSDATGSLNLDSVVRGIVGICCPMKERWAKKVSQLTPLPLKHFSSYAPWSPTNNTSSDTSCHLPGGQPPLEDIPGPRGVEKPGRRCTSVPERRIKKATRRRQTLGPIAWPKCGRPTNGRKQSWCCNLCSFGQWSSRHRCSFSFSALA